MNKFQRFFTHTVLGIPADNSQSVINEDIKKTSDPTQKFQKPYHLRRHEPDKVPMNTIFYESEYDLHTIANARQLDGIINRAISVFKEQILKNGFEYVSKNDKAQQHIRRRLREIELFTNIKHTEIMASIADQLVTYGNAYIIKVRKDISNYGKRYKLFNKVVKPIVGIFVAEATTMSIGIDPEEQVRKYKQSIHGIDRYFNIEDVIHYTYNKLPGTLTGVSSINQVLDDVRALRKLEEEIEILGFQYAIPLYLYKVGTDSHPAAPGEVETVSNVVNNAPTYGLMVVPHTHDMKAVTSEGDSVDVMKFVQHFKSRIYAGLGVSPIAMSEVSTSNRNTSEIADIQMQTTTKSYQQIISNKNEQELIDEIIRDGGMDPLDINSELRFGEIDLEAQIKKENHILEKYQGNLISFEEARLESDRELVVDEKNMYLNKVQIPLLEAEAKAKASANPNQASSSSTSKAQKTLKASQNRVSNKNRPTNQHGKSLGRPKIKKDGFEDVAAYSTKIGKLLFTDGGNSSALNRDKYLIRLLPKIKDEITNFTQYTINSYRKYYHNDSIGDDSIIEEIYNFVAVKIKDKVRTMGNIKGDFADTKINYSLEWIEDVIDMRDKIENAIKILTLKSKGFPSISYHSSNCDIHSDLEVHESVINMNNVPPLSYNCECTVEDIEVWAEV